MNKIIKKCMNILLVVIFLLQQTGCATIWLHNQPPKRTYYQYRIDKVISAYMNKLENQLTICLEGTLNISDKSPTPQIFALQIPVTMEQLKQTPANGIRYSVFNDKIPSVEIAHSAVLPYCPNQSATDRSVAIDNTPSVVRKRYTPQELNKPNWLETFMQNIPIPPQNEPDIVYYSQIKQNTYTLDDFDLKKPYRELIYVTKPDNINTYPVSSRFDGQYFLMITTENMQKESENTYNHLFLLPIAITIDVLLSPVYLVGGIIFLVACSISSGRGCLRM